MKGITVRVSGSECLDSKLPAQATIYPMTEIAWMSLLVSSNLTITTCHKYVLRCTSGPPDAPVIHIEEVPSGSS